MQNNHMSTCKSSSLYSAVVDVKWVKRHKHVSMLNVISICKMSALFDTYAIDHVNCYSLYNTVYMMGL